MHGGDVVVTADASLVRVAPTGGGGIGLRCARCPWWLGRITPTQRDMGTLIRMTRAHLSTHDGGPLAHVTAPALETACP